MKFKIYPDARQGSPWHFRAPATPSVPARRDRPLTHRDQAACDRPAGWRPMPLPRRCDVAAPIPCANLSRSADFGRRGNAGTGHTALDCGNRRKGLAVSSALKNRPGSQVLRPRNITIFPCLRGVRSGGSFNLPTSGGLRLAVSGGRCGHRPSAPTRPRPRRRRSYDGVRRMTKDSGQSEGPKPAFPAAPRGNSLTIAAATMPYPRPLRTLAG